MPTLLRACVWSVATCWPPHKYGWALHSKACNDVSHAKTTHRKSRQRRTTRNTRIYLLNVKPHHLEATTKLSDYVIFMLQCSTAKARSVCFPLLQFTFHDENKIFINSTSGRWVFRRKKHLNEQMLSVVLALLPNVNMQMSSS